MTNDDEKKFKILIYALAEEYQYDFSPERLKMWWAQLKEFDYAEVATSVALCMRTCKFFPRLADIFEFLTPSRKEDAQSAWGELLISLRHSSDGEDPVTQKVVRMLGGVRRLAMMNEDDLKFKEKKFIELYSELNKKTVVSSQATIAYAQKNLLSMVKQ